jgi:hypothetical protein
MQEGKKSKVESTCRCFRSLFNGLVGNVKQMQKSCDPIHILQTNTYKNYIQVTTKFHQTPLRHLAWTSPSLTTSSLHLTQTSLSLTTLDFANCSKFGPCLDLSHTWTLCRTCSHTSLRLQVAILLKAQTLLRLHVYPFPLAWYAKVLEYLGAWTLEDIKNFSLTKQDVTKKKKNLFLACKGGKTLKTLPQDMHVDVHIQTP